MKKLLLLFAGFFTAATVCAEPIAGGAGGESETEDKAPEVASYTFANETLSPDGTRGVHIPEGVEYKEEDGNVVVDARSGEEILTIRATTGAVHQNHGGNTAAWSKDGAYLLWTVEGKWFPRAVVLVDFSDKKEPRQLNVLTLCQKEFLQRTKAKFPTEYAATKQRDDAGPAYPDGFTIDLDFDRKQLEFPLKIKLSLTNDPKGMAEVSRDFAHRLLEGSVTAEISADFSAKFSGFKMLATEEALAARQQ